MSKASKMKERQNLAPALKMDWWQSLLPISQTALLAAKNPDEHNMGEYGI